MDEQKMKKKRKAADYSLIGGLIALAIVILCIFIEILSINFDNFDKDLARVVFSCLSIATYIFIIFSIIAGFIGLLNRSIGDQGKFIVYLKAFLGIGISGAVYLIMLPIPLGQSYGLMRHKEFQLRAKQSEAKQNLEAIYAAYQAYHNNHHSYPSSPLIQKGEAFFDCFKIADWQPKETWIRYNYNCMNTEVFSPANSNYPCPSGIVTTATNDSFTISSCGNLDNDTTVDVWTINDAKHLRNVIDDVKR